MERGDTDLAGWHLYALVAGCVARAKYVIRIRESHLFNPSNLGWWSRSSLGSQSSNPRLLGTPDPGAGGGLPCDPGRRGAHHRCLKLLPMQRLLGSLAGGLAILRCPATAAPPLGRAACLRRRFWRIVRRPGATDLSLFHDHGSKRFRLVVPRAWFSRSSWELPAPF